MSVDPDPAIERAAQIAAAHARRQFAIENRLAARADLEAEVVGAGRAGNTLATALADAYLAAREWDRRSLRDATVVLLGKAPRWTIEVVADVLNAYSRAPADRPRELARFIARLRSFRSNVLGAPGASPDAKPLRLLDRRVTTTATVRRPFATPRLDSVADLAAWLELSTEELAWFADARHMNRRAGDRRLHHYCGVSHPVAGSCGVGERVQDGVGDFGGVGS